MGPRVSDHLRNVVVELASVLGLVPSPDHLGRPDGISAVVRVKDEEWWIEPSLLSIKNLVDEYIVIDGSTDNTPKIIDEVGESEDLDITHIIDFDEDYVRVSNKALEQTKYRWILRWDADFVARKEMASTLKNLIQSLNQRRNYVVYFPHISLDGDLFHQDPLAPLDVEHWLTSYTDKTAFIRIPQGYEYLFTPFHYAKRIQINNPLSFHLRSVKPKKRLLLRRYFHEIQADGLQGKISLQEYALRKIRVLYGVDTLEAAAEIYFKEFTNKLSLYDKNKYCDYPTILKGYAKKRFGIIL